MKRWQTAVWILPFGWLAACGEEPPPQTPEPPPPPPPTAKPTPTVVQSKADEGTSGQVNISPDIRAACNISDPEAFFAFNSATVRKGDHPALDKLAVCFTTGPLAGRKMRLVGHADPRGEDSYNLALGERRANGVKQYLVNAGMNGAQGELTSRGEMDASGTDESSWAKDRRVDIMLAD